MDIGIENTLEVYDTSLASQLLLNLAVNTAPTFKEELKEILTLTVEGNGLLLLIQT